MRGFVVVTGYGGEYLVGWESDEKFAFGGECGCRELRAGLRVDWRTVRVRGGLWLVRWGLWVQGQRMAGFGCCAEWSWRINNFRKFF